MRQLKGATCTVSFAPAGNCPCVRDGAGPRTAFLATWLWGQHAHFIGSLGLRSVSGPADRAAVGDFADQTQTGAAGDGPGDSHLVSLAGIGRLPVPVSGRDTAPAKPQSAGPQGWLAGADGGAGAGWQLRFVSDGPEPAEPWHRTTGGADGPDPVADRQPVRVQGALQRGAGDWPAGFVDRLRAVFQSATGRVAHVPDRLHHRGADGAGRVDGLDLLCAGPEAIAHGVEFVAGDDGDLPVLRAAVDAMGASAGGAATEPVAGLATVGMLSQYFDCLWRICRSAGPLGGVAGECDPGDYAIGDVCGGGDGGLVVA